MSLLRRQIELFLCAVQFLTRLPVPRLPGFEPDWTTRSARYFPLVGQLVAAISAGTLLLAAKAWAAPLPALLAVAVGVLVTGALHEDGLSDAADGLGGGRDPEHRLAIMKDSRVGAYGVLALVLLLAIKTTALAQIPLDVAAASLLLAHGGGRAAALVVMRLQRHVSDPAQAKYKPAPDGVRTWEMMLGLGFAAWPLLLLPIEVGLIAAAAGAVLALLLALVSRRLVGGYTGDVLGAVEQVFEAGCLLGASAALALAAQA